MAVFNDVKNALKEAEGGYTTGKGDYGGETNMGISKRQYPNLDIKNLTTAQIYEIYERDFWNRYRINEIVDQRVANAVFLTYINMDPLQAGRIVQRTLNIFTRQALLLDGVMGSKTLKELNFLSPTLFVPEFKLMLISYYLAEVEANPKQLVNFKGWVRRALNL